MRGVGLWVAALLAGAEARSQVVGDALEWGVPRGSKYLKRRQVVGVISPNSDGRREVDRKAGTFVGESRRKGIVWWVKKEKKPLLRFRASKPFKIRLLRLNTESVVETLIEQEKLEVELTKIPQGPNKGKEIVTVKLAKPTPWYRRLV